MIAWDKYFLDIAEAVSKKSHCLSIQRGCVIVREKQILSTGYNGPPTGYIHCADTSCGRCIRKNLGFTSGQGLEFCPASHAEANAIVQAARNGVKIEGSTIYCNFSHIPCRECAKLIVNSGIKRIVLNAEKQVYPQPGLSGADILSKCEIEIVGVNNAKEGN